MSRQSALNGLSNTPALYCVEPLFIPEDTMIGTIGFLFWSAVVLAPVLMAVAAAARFLHRDRFIWLARVAVATGFLAGGIIGWSFVPAEWTASLWTTIDAAGDGVKYGHAFEHTAERALMWFFYSAVLGELALGMLALLLVWRLAEPRSARRSMA
jgi:hypothetical protein